MNIDNLCQDILAKARYLVRDETHWTRQAYSRDLPEGDRAFCSVGALREAKRLIAEQRGMSETGLVYEAYNEACTRLSAAFTPERVPVTDANWARDRIIAANDATTNGGHPRVLAAFDEALS